MLQEDSDFELHENAYQNVCTELVAENSFSGNSFARKPGSQNANSKKDKKNLNLCRKEKK